MLFSEGRRGINKFSITSPETFFIEGLTDPGGFYARSRALNNKEGHPGSRKAGGFPRGGRISRSGSAKHMRSNCRPAMSFYERTNQLLSIVKLNINADATRWEFAS